MAGDKKTTAKRISSARPVKINPNAPIKAITPDVDGKYKCSCCGKVYPRQSGYFSVTNSVLYKGNNGYLTICRSCAEKYYQQLIDFYSGNKEHALEHCCWLFDWYYNPDIIPMLHNSEKGRTEVSNYTSRMNMIHVQKKGTTYLDTIKDKSKERIMSVEDVRSSNEADSSEKESIAITADIIKEWGTGYTNDEYQYLIDQYKDWTTRHECKTKAQEELFRTLCVAQLSIRRAQEKGVAKELSEATKVFQDLLGSANLKPSQTNDNTLIEQNTFGTLIKKYENEKPICEPDPQWQDVDGIKQYIDTYFLGHLAKLVHIKNDNEEAYSREMEKYTVKPPEYLEEEQGDTSLLDKYSDKVDKPDGD